jgi:hypothetical protein
VTSSNRRDRSRTPERFQRPASEWLRSVAGVIRAAVVVVLAASVAPATLGAQQTFYAAYEDALDALKQRDWAKAEQLLKLALQRNPRQGRRVLFYGTRREDYLPEFYLAIVYLNQQRAQEALDLFAKVEKAGLVAAGSREHPELQRLTIDARAIVDKQRLAKTVPPPTVTPPAPPPAVGAAPAPTTGGGVTGALAGRGGDDTAATLARAEAERRDRLAALVSQAANDITAGRLEAARSRVAEARAAGVDTSRADELEHRIDVAVAEGRVQSALTSRDWAAAQRLTRELRVLDSRNARLRDFDAAVAKGLADASTAVLRTALRAFFGGDYQTSIRLLEPLTAESRSSPRAVLYLAFSNAALGLLEGSRDSPRLRLGRQLYARARESAQDFSADRRFVSPQILKALEAQSR